MHAANSFFLVPACRQGTVNYSGPPQYPIPKNVSDLVTFTTMPRYAACHFVLLLLPGSYATCLSGRDHLGYTFIWVSLFVALSFMARQAVFFKPKVQQSRAEHVP